MDATDDLVAKTGAEKMEVIKQLNKTPTEYAKITL